jgi:hypothetical protein
MKKIISICLCLVIITIPVTSAFSETAEYTLSEMARRSKVNRKIAARQFYLIGLISTGIFLMTGNSMDEETKSLLIGWTVGSGLLGYYLMITPAGTERKYLKIRDIPSADERESQSYSIVSKRAKKDRITRYIAFILEESLGVYLYNQDTDIEEPSIVPYFFMGLGIYFLIKRTPAEKYMKNQPINHSEINITPVLSRDYVGLAVVNRF